MTRIPNNFFQWALWISTILIILIGGLQGLSGNWITFFLVWPGGPDFGQAFTQFLAALSAYHIGMGFVVGALSVLIIIFAFLAKSGLYVKILSFIGLIMTALAAAGGVLYVNSAFQDRMGLGQMADAFVGMIGIYLIQLFFMNRTPVFPWNRAKKAK